MCALFRRLNVSDDRLEIDVEVDGMFVKCRAGDSVAAVVLMAGGKPYRRNVVSGDARAPLCMMGVCFECLIEIDGVPNQQGCLRTVEQGMLIRRQLQPLGDVVSRSDGR